MMRRMFASSFGCFSSLLGLRRLDKSLTQTMPARNSLSPSSTVERPQPNTSSAARAMLLVSPVALLTRPRIPVSVCFPTGISSCAWLSFLLHMKIPINGMLAITLSLINIFVRKEDGLGLAGCAAGGVQAHRFVVINRQHAVGIDGPQVGARRQWQPAHVDRKLDLLRADAQLREPSSPLQPDHA